MGPKLEAVFIIRCYVSKEDTINVGATTINGPTCSVSCITHGSIQGSGLDAKILHGSNNWISFNPTTKIRRVSLRISASTSEGDNFAISLTGVMKVDDEIKTWIAWYTGTESTDFGDHHWFAAVTMETNSERFNWVETEVLVARGRCVVDGGETAAEYEIMKICN